MSEATSQPATGAENIVWDLSIFYSGPEDPAIEADMAAIDADIAAFAGDYRGQVAGLDAAGLLAAMERIEALLDRVYRLEMFAQMLYVTDTNNPTFGGWRQVLVLYGLLAIVISLLWLLLHPAGKHAVGDDDSRPDVIAGLRRVVRLRNLWLMGLGGIGIGACFSGFSGYLPTYLKNVGWAPLDADRALSLFFLASLICVVPLSTLSDRLQIRRGFLVALALLLGIGVGLLGVVAGALVLLVALVTGSAFDSVMAMQQVSVMEIDGMDNSLSGSALGMFTTIRNLGIAFAPPLGNSLAIYGAGLPFLFWGACGVFAALVFSIAFNPPRRATA